MPNSNKFINVVDTIQNQFRNSLKYIKGDQLLDNFDDICYPNFILCTPKSFPVFTNKSYLNPAHNCLSYVNKDFIHGEAR